MFVFRRQEEDMIEMIVFSVCVFFGLQEYEACKCNATKMKHISKNPCFWWEERMFFHLDIDCELYHSEGHAA